MSMGKASCLQWFAEINLCALSLSTLLFSVLIMKNIKYDNFLSASFSFNVKKNFISNVRFSDNGICYKTEEKANLGIWSGVPENSCFCVEKESKIPRTFDKRCEHIKDSTLDCKSPGTKVDSIVMHNYKNFTVCIERGNVNYENLFSSKSQDLGSAIRGLTNTTNFLVTNIKLINMNLTTAQEMQSMIGEVKSGELKELSKDYFLFVRRVNISDFSSLKSLEKLVVDISLSNEVWCSLADFNPPLTETILKSKIETTYDFCNKFYKAGAGYFFNDLDKRTERINLKEDPWAKKSDFYAFVENNTIFEAYENITKLQSNLSLYEYGITGANEPVLVYEKVWPGLYCDGMINPSDLINKFEAEKGLNSLSNAIFVFQIGLIITVFARKISQTLDLEVFFIWIQVSALIICTILIILAVYFCVSSKNTWAYLTNFQNNCQIDYTTLDITSSKASPLEREMLYRLKTLSGFGLVLASFYALFILYVSFLILSRMKCASLHDGAGNTGKRESVLSKFAF